MVEETYDVKFDESNGSQGAHENLDDVGDEPLREAVIELPNLYKIKYGCPRLTC